MNDRILTGIAGLDQILYGGVPQGNAILVEGPPGSGKTTLGLQFIVEGIRQFDENGIVVTFEQFPQQLYRDAATFGWNLQQLESENKLRVICTSPPVLERMLRGPENVLEKLQKEMHAKRILVDSVTHLQRITENPVQLRELLHTLINGLKLQGFTPMLTKEVTAGDTTAIDFEEYVVDTVIRLNHAILSGARGARRWIEVRKARGQQYAEGQHPYKITDEGISVFPYLRPKERRLSRVALNDVERVPSGVPGLDDLLMGGYVRDTTILLAGPSGSGKTTLGLHFLVNGASRGESGLLLSFQESPDRIAQMMCMLDPDTPRYIDDGLLYIEHILPLDVCVEETFHKLMAWCDEYGLRRLVVDSITDLLSGSDDELIVRDQAYTLVKLMEEKGVTTLMTYEMPQMSGSVTISEIGFSFIADAVIYLGFAEIESEMSKVIGVLKLRGGRHQTDLRELLVTERGLRVGAKFTGLSGILQGTPIGQYRETVEEILQPLAFINDFIDVLREGELDEEMRHEVLSNMKEQTEHVIRLLCEKYDIEYETVMSGAQEGM